MALERGTTEWREEQNGRRRRSAPSVRPLSLIRRFYLILRDAEELVARRLLEGRAIRLSYIFLLGRLGLDRRPRRRVASRWLRVPSGRCDFNRRTRAARQWRAAYGNLHEEHRRLTTAIESSRDAIWISDASGRIVMVNSALERLSGRGRATLLGQPCRLLLGAHTRAGARSAARSAPSCT